MGERIQVGDYVRIVNYLLNGQMPVGKVVRKDGWYIYVSVGTNQYKGSYEVYENEIVKITEQEYFKLLLTGVNDDV